MPGIIQGSKVKIFFRGNEVDEVLVRKVISENNGIAETIEVESQKNRGIVQRLVLIEGRWRVLFMGLADEKCINLRAPTYRLEVV